MAGRVEDIGFEDFRRMAADPGLSPHEKIGFPDAYREGYEPAIFEDITSKLSALRANARTVLDIGPGCAGLPRRLISLCEANRHRLFLVDSQEMLCQLPDSDCVTRIVGSFPDCGAELQSMKGGFDAILCYSVLHYVFVESCFWKFLDSAIELLAPGGEMLLGDIPNLSKRRRFFASAAGRKFHKEFMGTQEDPVVKYDTVEPGRIDDAVILGIILRARAQGCDAYWLRQPSSLPMANRREDILIARP